MERDAIHELSAAYALDALDADDERAYEDHLAHCHTCREEVAALRATAAQLAYLPEAPAPPPALGERILAQARDERRTVVPLERRRWQAWTGAAAAVAAVVALALGLWSLSLSRALDEERQTVALLGNPAARSVPLAGARGRLVIGEDGQAALVVGGLAPAPSERTYQIWVIEGASPAPAGLFEGGEEREVVALTRPVPRGAQVAVTLEREGGADAPTTEPLFATVS